MTPKPKKELRPVFEYANELGFESPEVTGSGHWRFKHRETGKSVYVSSTPSDRGRFEIQARAELRRAAPAKKVVQMRERVAKRKSSKGTPRVGALQESIIDILVDSEPDGMTAREIEKRLAMSYPAQTALYPVEKRGLVYADRSSVPHVWHAFLPEPAAPSQATEDQRPAQPSPVAPPAELQEEPPKKAAEDPSPAPAPTPAPAQERKSEAATALLAEVVTTFEVKMVRDTEGRHWLVLPFSFGGPK